MSPKQAELVSLRVETPSTPLNDNQKLVVSIAQDIVSATLGVAEKYRDLCKTIRDKAIPPAEVRIALRSVGMADSRISEVNRIANLPDAQWNEFAARQIGMKKVLELSRSAEADDAPPADAPQTYDEDTRHLMNALSRALKLASKLGLRSKSAKLDNYQIVVKRVKLDAKPAAQPKPAVETPKS